MKYLKFILTACLLLCVVVVKAHDFKVDDIYYNILSPTDKTVEVTYRGGYSSSYDNEYTGSVVIPESVTYNGSTYSVTSIGDWAFDCCKGLTSITIPNSVTSIGDCAFEYCTGLTSITIPNSVTSIGNSAFSYCSGLTNVTIPNSVTSIGDWVFSGCDGLTSITIPNSVTSIGEGAFVDCSNLKKVEIDCQSVGSWFGNNTSITEVVIGNNATSIGERAFRGCYGLTSVVIGNSVTSIGEGAFYECGLTSIEIPNSVTSIGDYAFFFCAGLTSIEIPNSVTSIGEGAFFFCFGLTSVEIPNSVTSIGDWVFSGCDGLTSITIPNSVTSIGSSAFSGCTGLTSIEIPGSVTDIRHRAFNDCTSLKELCIEDGEDVLVLGCNDVEKGLFYDCPLETLYLGRILSYEKSSEFGSSPFYGVETLASVGIGASGLDENLFAGCANINNLGFNTEVVPYIFANYASVTDVTLSGRVKTIADGAFVGMDNLANVVLETPVPPAISSDVFDSLHYKQLYVYLLDGCTPIYQASEIWKNFLDIQEYAPDGVGASVAANVWRDYWDIPEYTVPQGELEENLFADLSQLERVSDGVRLPNAKGVCVSVYTFGGSLIKNVSCYSGETIVLDKGAYIIVTDSNALKVVL